MAAEPRPPKSRRLHPKTVQSPMIQSLHDGPKTPSELTSHPNTDHQRDITCRLKPPRTPTGFGNVKTRRGGSRHRTTIYYLWGDERRAVRRFIEENEAFVASCLEDNCNPLIEQWDPVLYQMLCEEWQLRGVAGGDG